jgi:hypothetical protein
MGASEHRPLATSTQLGGYPAAGAGATLGFSDISLAIVSRSTSPVLEVSPEGVNGFPGLELGGHIWVEYHNVRAFGEAVGVLAPHAIAEVILTADIGVWTVSLHRIASHS